MESVKNVELALANNKPIVAYVTPDGSIVIRMTRL